MESCKNGDWEKVNKLIKNGMKGRLMDNKERTALHFAMTKSSFDIKLLKLFIGYDYCWGLQAACFGGNKKMINFITSIKINEDIINDGLSGACLAGKKEIIRSMMSLGGKNYNKGMFYACLGWKKKFFEYFGNYKQFFLKKKKENK